VYGNGGAHPITVRPAAGFTVRLCSGKADWAKARYLSAIWDVGNLTLLEDKILRDDLLVNRLRAGV